MAFQINTACTKCGACLYECPTQSIIEGLTHYVIDSDTCSDHEACVAVCPVNAIERIPPPKETRAAKDKKK